MQCPVGYALGQCSSSGNGTGRIALKKTQTLNPEAPAELRCTACASDYGRADNNAPWMS